MDDSEFTMAFTQGIFVHKPVAKKLKSPAKSNAKQANLCHRQYDHISNSMQERIKEIEKNAYGKTFGSLVKFVKECHSLGSSVVQEIPSAILVMGVNMPDHANIFGLLEQRMNAEGIFATVKLQSKECGSFSNLMQKLVSGIISKYHLETGLSNVTLKKVDNTLAKLLSFYTDLPDFVPTNQNSRRSPRKTPTKNTSEKSLKDKPMVVLLQDVEAFSVDILQELILNCSLYSSRLPLVLVFGMASAMVTLHNILPQKTLSCLGIETFYSLTAIEYLTKILHQVVLSPENPFKLGPKVFRLIVDTVLYHDFSVTNLTNMLQFCLIEHFYGNDVASLCCPPERISQNLDSLSNEQLAKFRELPSLFRFLDNNREKMGRSNFKASIKELLLKQHTYYKQLFVYLNCLHLWTKDLPNNPLGKHIRELYPLAFESNLTSLPSYLQVAKLLKLISKEELMSKLEGCINILNETAELDEELSTIKESFCHHLQDLKKCLSEGDADDKPRVVNDFSVEKVTSRAQLQDRLRQQLKSKRSKYETCRENIVTFVTSCFQKMQSPMQLPLHEVLYFDDVVAVKRHLMFMPRITMHRDLVDPSARLKCSCCKIHDNKELCATMPDISVLYKLHLECGKLINLYDWLQAFKAVKMDSSDESNVDEETEMNIRFMHSVSELQHLGFIKGTKRKTDHVARLTFHSV